MNRSLVFAGLTFSLLLPPLLGCSNLPTLSRACGAGDESEPAKTAARHDEIIPPSHRLNEQPTQTPPMEWLDEPAEDTVGGLSLDAAIDRLISASVDLAAKFQDIPKARADILTAGLRNDPVVFLSATSIPYGRYSVQRPGAASYDITVVQSLDVSGKHRANKRVAEKNIAILEARYQDAVRLEIDRLATAYVNVLETRAVVRAARSNFHRLAEAARMIREQVGQGRHPKTDSMRAAIHQASARIALQRAEAGLVHARRNLAVLLALPAEEADHLRVCGSLRDRSPPPPVTEELIALARRVRPDLLAYQLSVDRGQAEVRREQAEAVEDVFCSSLRIRLWIRHRKASRSPVRGRLACFFPSPPSIATRVRSLARV